jgi:hypothetical protein
VIWRIATLHSLPTLFSMIGVLTSSTAHNLPIRHRGSRSGLVMLETRSLRVPSSIGCCWDVAAVDVIGEKMLVRIETFLCIHRLARLDRLASNLVAIDCAL